MHPKHQRAAEGSRGGQGRKSDRARIESGRKGESPPRGPAVAPGSDRRIGSGRGSVRARMEDLGLSERERPRTRRTRRWTCGQVDGLSGVSWCWGWPSAWRAAATRARPSRLRGPRAERGNGTGEGAGGTEPAEAPAYPVETVLDGLTNPSGVTFDEYGQLTVCDGAGRVIVVEEGLAKDYVTGFETEFWKIDPETGTKRYQLGPLSAAWLPGYKLVVSDGGKKDGEETILFFDEPGSADSPTAQSGSVGPTTEDEADKGEGNLTGFSVSPDGKTVWVCGQGADAATWVLHLDTETRELTPWASADQNGIEINSPMQTLVWDDDTLLVLYSGAGGVEDGTIVAWSIASKTPKQTWTLPGLKDPMGMARIPGTDELAVVDNNWALTTVNRGRVARVRLGEEDATVTLTGVELAGPTSCAFGPDGKLYVAVLGERFGRDAWRGGRDRRLGRVTLYESVPSPYLVPFDGSFKVEGQPTAPPSDTPGKKSLVKQLGDLKDELRGLQRRLYAQDRNALWLVFQAMDAAGKDGTIRHLLRGVNPAGCEVYSFKQPSAEELDHDFLWRTSKRLPQRGRIGVFNRSHYEEVLVVRVHPEYLGGQRIPMPAGGLDALWRERYASIREHESHVARNGTRILKFWLNVSKEEQRKRFLSRLDEPEKNWKFSVGDVRERGRWDDYMAAYEEALASTSRACAPWYAIPADNKRYMRLTVAQIVTAALREMSPRYPEVDPKDREQFAEMRALLEGEADASSERVG